MNPLELIDKIEREKKEGWNGFLTTASDEWQSLRAAIEAQAAELEQANDIRDDAINVLAMVAEELGVDQEPHQIFNERLIEAAAQAKKGWETTSEYAKGCGETIAMLQDELAQARARIGRLEDALRRMDSMHELMMRDANHGASCYQNGTIREMNEAPIQAAKALNESPAQSLAAVRAEVLREARNGIDPDWTGMDAIVAIDDLIDDYEETEREAKEES